MGFAVFVHRADSIYDDRPDEQYQFPRQYLSRVKATEGNWIIYYEPTKVRSSRGYFAVAKIERVVADPANPEMYLALMEPGSYLAFAVEVPFLLAAGRPAESGLLNAAGRLSGRAQAAVRSLAPQDFNLIVTLGLDGSRAILPRVADIGLSKFDQRGLAELEQTPFEIERDRTTLLVSRAIRNPVFRTGVLRAYDARCAVTGFKFINGGGRAEVEAAHIRPVEAGGPDAIPNGIALSGTVHWMFDRGLLAVGDDLEIQVSRHVNDREGVGGLINPTGRLIAPTDPRLRPRRDFLAWHREHVFKV